LSDAVELPNAQVGELIVAGNVVTRQYVTRKEANALAKIVDGAPVWHRMGDVGYLDQGERFWFCGRMAHRVRTAAGDMFTIPCEAIFNQHPDVDRSALVGIGPADRQRPVIIIEPRKGRMPGSRAQRERFVGELLELARGNALTAGIRDILFHPSMPVDIRHNSKIFREKLAVWAAAKLR
jgi:acyl-CoA synthetase (AMP-forming)/AMP-acid ligase II